MKFGIKKINNLIAFLNKKNHYDLIEKARFELRFNKSLDYLSFFKDKNFDFKNFRYFNRDLFLIYISYLILNDKNSDETKELLKKYVSLFGFKDIKNHLVICDFAVKNNFTTPEIEKSAVAYKKLKNFNLQEYIRGKSIAIVGNSPSLLNQKKGKEINSKDIVLRFNNFKTKGFENDCGSKTDIWVIGGGANDIKKREEIFPATLFCVDFSRYRIFNSHINQILKSKNVYNIETAFHTTLYKNCPITYPTAGLLTIWTLFQINGNFENINLYGFNFQNKVPENFSTHYFNGRNEKTAKNCSLCHNYSEENEFLKRIYDI